MSANNLQGIIWHPSNCVHRSFSLLSLSLSLSLSSLSPPSIILFCTCTYIHVYTNISLSLCRQVLVAMVTQTLPRTRQRRSLKRATRNHQTMKECYSGHRQPPNLISILLITEVLLKAKITASQQLVPVWTLTLTVTLMTLLINF